MIGNCTLESIDIVENLFTFDKQKIKIMKRLILYLEILFVILISISCSQVRESENGLLEGQTRSNVQNERDANRILIKYVKVDENKLVYLDISLEDARKLGIPDEFYERAIDDIRRTNEEIRKLNDEGVPVQIDLPTFQSPAVSVAAGKVQYPGGSFSVNGNGPDDEAEAFLWLPDGMLGFEFRCRCNAALVCYKCKTNSFGVTNMNSAVGSPWSNTSVSVALAASNTYGSVCFSCSDPNGASASYSGY